MLSCYSLIRATVENKSIKDEREPREVWRFIICQELKGVGTCWGVVGACGVLAIGIKLCQPSLGQCATNPKHSPATSTTSRTTCRCRINNIEGNWLLVEICSEGTFQGQKIVIRLQTIQLIIKYTSIFWAGVGSIKIWIFFFLVQLYMLRWIGSNSWIYFIKFTKTKRQKHVEYKRYTVSCNKAMAFIT